MSRGNKSSKHCVECEEGVGIDHLSRAFSSVTQICNFYSSEWNQISSLNLMKTFLESLFQGESRPLHTTHNQLHLMQAHKSDSL